MLGLLEAQTGLVRAGRAAVVVVIAAPIAAVLPSFCRQVLDQAALGDVVVVSAV